MEIPGSSILPRENPLPTGKRSVQTTLPTPWSQYSMHCMRSRPQCIKASSQSKSPNSPLYALTETPYKALIILQGIYRYKVTLKFNCSQDFNSHLIKESGKMLLTFVILVLQFTMLLSQHHCTHPIQFHGLPPFNFLAAFSDRDLYSYIMARRLVPLPINPLKSHQMEAYLVGHWFSETVPLIKITISLRSREITKYSLRAHRGQPMTRCGRTTTSKPEWQVGYSNSQPRTAFYLTT